MWQLSCKKAKSLQGVPFHCHVLGEHLNPHDTKKEKPNLPNANAFIWSYYISVLADGWIFLVPSPISQRQNESRSLFLEEIISWKNRGKWAQGKDPFTNTPDRHWLSTQQCQEAFHLEIPRHLEQKRDIPVENQENSKILPLNPLFLNRKISFLQVKQTLALKQPLFQSRVPSRQRSKMQQRHMKTTKKPPRFPPNQHWPDLG